VSTLHQISTQLLAALPNMRLLFVAMIAIAAFLFARGLFAILSWAANPARRRLGALSGAGEEAASWATAFTAAVQPFARYMIPTSGKERGTMQDKLIKSGIQSPDALPIFYGIKTLLALVFLIAWLLVSHLLPRLATSQVWLYGAAAAVIGMSIPNFVLNRMVDKRQRLLRNAFPDALDLLVVCVESGLGLAAGLQRVALELQVSAPELAAELDRVNAEMQAGMERELALRNLATRTGLADIRSLVALLVQTLRFGTGIADALRVFSEEFRDKRIQLAEEQAAKLGTKMIFPMVLCFFPSFFLVAVGPAVIRAVRVFGHGGP
jgi:tight adherence protein C